MFCVLEPRQILVNTELAGRYANVATLFLILCRQIDLPVQGPIIVNVQTKYQPGEMVMLNCTSAPSNPMAILNWYINDELVRPPLPFVSIPSSLTCTLLYSIERQSDADDDIIVETAPSASSAAVVNLH